MEIESQRVFNIVVTGNKIISDKLQRKKVVERIGKEIAKGNNFCIVNAGVNFTKNNKPASVDYLVCKGAKDFLKKSVNEKVITLHPRRSHQFPLHKIGLVKYAKMGSTYWMVEMVNQADCILMIEGDDGAEHVCEVGRILGKPILPIPCTDGYSDVFWKKYEETILNQFSIKKPSPEYNTLVEKDIKKPAVLAKTIVNILHKRFGPPCFIAMQYGGKFEQVYDEAIVPGLQESGFTPIRIDKNLRPGNIIKQIYDKIRDCHLFLADITKYNPNVMMEVGIASAYGKPIILITQSKKVSLKQLIPFNLSGIITIEYKKNALKLLKKKITRVSSSKK